MLFKKQQHHVSHISFTNKKQQINKLMLHEFMWKSLHIQIHEQSFRVFADVLRIVCPPDHRRAWEETHSVKFLACSLLFASEFERHLHWVNRQHDFSIAKSCLSTF